MSIHGHLGRCFHDFSSRAPSCCSCGSCTSFPAFPAFTFPACSLSRSLSTVSSAHWGRILHGHIIGPNASGPCVNGSPLFHWHSTGLKQSMDSIPLPHGHSPTPRPFPYPTAIPLPHGHSPTPRPFPYPTAIPLPHGHSPTPRPFDGSESR